MLVQFILLIIILSQFVPITKHFITINFFYHFHLISISQFNLKVIKLFHLFIPFSPIIIPTYFLIHWRCFHHNPIPLPYIKNPLIFTNIPFRSIQTFILLPWVISPYHFPFIHSIQILMKPIPNLFLIKQLLPPI